MVEHRELIERLEKLDGPSREVDCAIAIALEIYPEWFRPGEDEELYVRTDDPLGPNVVRKQKGKRKSAGNTPIWYTHPVYRNDERCPEFTASLDAAVALGERMLPGQVWHLMTAALKAWSIKDGKPADLARFYCIALLRALEGGNDG